MPLSYFGLLYLGTNTRTRYFVNWSRINLPTLGFICPSTRQSRKTCAAVCKVFSCLDGLYIYVNGRLLVSVPNLSAISLLTIGNHRFNIQPIVAVDYQLEIQFDSLQSTETSLTTGQDFDQFIIMRTAQVLCYFGLYCFGIKIGGESSHANYHFFSE